MSFVNEDISNEDMVKYRIDEMAWGYQSDHYRYWVIDRERDIYLRRASDDRGETDNEYWSFYWKGYQWPVYGYRLSHTPKSELTRGQKTMRFKFTKFPPDLVSRLDEVRADFEEAYCSYRWHTNKEINFIYE